MDIVERANKAIGIPTYIVKESSTKNAVTVESNINIITGTAINSMINASFKLIGVSSTLGKTEALFELVE